MYNVHLPLSLMSSGVLVKQICRESCKTNENITQLATKIGILICTTCFFLSIHLSVFPSLSLSWTPFFLTSNTISFTCYIHTHTDDNINKQAHRVIYVSHILEPNVCVFVSWTSKSKSHIFQICRIHVFLWWHWWLYPCVSMRTL